MVVSKIIYVTVIENIDKLHIVIMIEIMCSIGKYVIIFLFIFVFVLVWRDKRWKFSLFLFFIIVIIVNVDIFLAVKNRLI